MEKAQIIQLEKDFKAYKFKLLIKRCLYALMICAYLGCGIFALQIYKEKQNALKIARDEKKKMQEKLELAKVQIQKAQILNKKREVVAPKEPSPKPIKEKIIIHSYAMKADTLEHNFHQKAEYKTALQLAQLYFDDNNYDKALWWSLKANELDKNDAGAWVVFAKAKFALGKKDEAKKVVQSFLRFYDDGSILDEVGYILK